MAQHHLDLLLVALLYGCAFTGALLVANSLVMLAFLSGALLVTIALAASDACRLAGQAARVAEAAAANMRLARAIAVYAVLWAAVRVVLVVRSKIGALASRVRKCAADRGLVQRGFGFVQLLSRCLVSLDTLDLSLLNLFSEDITSLSEEDALPSGCVGGCDGSATPEASSLGVRCSGDSAVSDTSEASTSDVISRYLTHYLPPNAGSSKSFLTTTDHPNLNWT
ncbi:hypothetical protein EJB05_54011, partial [Eragrostis curvula]